MSRLNGDQKYNSYSKGTGLNQPVQNILSASGVDLTKGGWFKNFKFSKLTFAIQN